MFKRHGVPEKLQLMTFKCIQCGKEVSILVCGKCPVCNKKTLKKSKDMNEEHKNVCSQK
ncbi:MAG: hypothetical protein QXD72_02410 [Candidatus Aenigmatarchaeota archaeon]